MSRNLSTMFKLLLLWTPDGQQRTTTAPMGADSSDEEHLGLAPPHAEELSRLTSHGGRPTCQRRTPQHLQDNEFE